jgi:6,7-dimethyl-8-ribityllumazine synthase
MAQLEITSPLEMHVKLPFAPRVAIIEARFYTHINDMLLDGIKTYLDANNCSHAVYTLPGALEIPAALNFLKYNFDAFVVVGCVIRGATSHYETVCLESNRGVMDVMLQHDLCVGNAILTVENEAQAVERSDKNQMNKGAYAAAAALKLLQIKTEIFAE